MLLNGSIIPSNSAEREFSRRFSARVDGLYTSGGMIIIVK